MGPSYKNVAHAHGTCPIHGGIYKGPLPLFVRHAGSPPRANGPRGGPWPRKRRFRVRRFLAQTAFGGVAPSYTNRGLDQLIQPSSRIAQAACQIFVMCLIFPPVNSIQYT